MIVNHENGISLEMLAWEGQGNATDSPWALTLACEKLEEHALPPIEIGFSISVALYYLQVLLLRVCWLSVQTFRIGLDKDGASL